VTRETSSYRPIELNDVAENESYVTHINNVLVTNVVVKLYCLVII